MMNQQNDLQTKVKSRVSSKVVLAGIAVAALIGVSLVTASLITPVGVGNFYAGSGDIKPPPQKPVCPEGDYTVKNSARYIYECEDSSKTHYCDIDLSDDYRCVVNGVTDNDKGCCLNKAPKGCEPGTTACGAYCCVEGQSCTSYLLKKFCTADTCPPQYPKKCLAANRNTCCPSDYSCGKSTVLGAEIAVCVPPDDGQCKGYCGKTDDGKSVCCNVGPDGQSGTDDDVTVCKVEQGIPFCMPKDADSCSAGEDLCVGGDKQRCCPTGTCAYDENLNPICNIDF